MCSLALATAVGVPAPRQQSPAAGRSNTATTFPHGTRPCVKTRRGARLLDSVRPDWAHLIDADKLDTASIVDCVLGQLFGSFGRGTLALQLSSDYAGHGFIPDNITSPAALDAAWRAEVARRCSA